MKAGRAIKIAGVNILVLVVFLCLVEGFFLAVFSWPGLLRHCPGFIQDTARALYITRDMRILQYLPECSRYDQDFGYTLKPGTCVFFNREFQSPVTANSQGLRDDEHSLVDPDIIVAGDSSALGWGVGQEEIFTSRLEKLSTEKVLNLSMASYGTARQMMRLTDMGINRVRTLVIQYADNDYEENLRYFFNNNRLPIMSREDYEKTAKRHARSKKYFFGKYVLTDLPGIVKALALTKKTQKKPDATDAAQKFLNCLWAAQMHLSQARIIVCELNHGFYFTDFLKCLEKEKNRPGQPEFIKKLEIVDFSGILGQEHFFLLDGHLNAIGHEKVARVLLEAVKSDAKDPKQGK